MNFLGFLAIVITVTGLVWLLQLLLKGNNQVDINLSIGRTNSAADTVSVSPTQQKSNIDTALPPADSILGDVLQTGMRSTGPEHSIYSSAPYLKPPLLDNSTVEKAVTQQGDRQNQTPRQNVKDSISPVEINPLLEDAYIDTVLKEAEFFDRTNVALLEEVNRGQLPPQVGQLTYSCFGSIAEQMPPDSFDKPQSPQHVEAMFELLRESTQRIEQQMIALNAVQRSLFRLATQHTEKAATGPANGDSQTIESQQEESSEYSFSDEEGLEESTFGGGLDAQLSSVYPEGESQGAQPTEFFSASEAGMDMPEEAFQSFDLNEISEPVTEVRQPIFNYLAGLNQTGELSYEVVAAVKRKAPTREVKHRVRQVLRAIDYYNFSSDANALLRVTAVFASLPENLEEFDEDIAAIGRKFGILAPSDEPVTSEDSE